MSFNLKVPKGPTEHNKFLKNLKAVNKNVFFNSRTKKSLLWSPPQKLHGPYVEVSNTNVNPIIRWLQIFKDCVLSLTGWPHWWHTLSRIVSPLFCCFNIWYWILTYLCVFKLLSVVNFVLIYKIWLLFATTSCQICQA